MQDEDQDQRPQQDQDQDLDRRYSSETGLVQSLRPTVSDHITDYTRRENSLRLPVPFVSARLSGQRVGLTIVGWAPHQSTFI